MLAPSLLKNLRNLSKKEKVETVITKQQIMLNIDNKKLDNDIVLLLIALLLLYIHWTFVYLTMYTFYDNKKYRY